MDKIYLCKDMKKDEYEMTRNCHENIDSSFIEKHLNNLYSNKELNDRIKGKEKLYSYDWQKIVCHSIAAKELNEEIVNNLDLYKIIDIKNVKFILLNNKLYLDKVSSWEDPYENFLCKSEHSKGKLHFSADTFIPYIFGQSWSVTPESDAMWRIYSQKGQYNDFVKKNIGWDDSMTCYTGIRLKVNARKLLEVCYVNDVSMAMLWMGKVRYCSISQIRRELQRSIKDGCGIGQVFGNSYFYKRTEFAHEKEFRVIYNFSTEERYEPQKNAKRISFPINASDLIEEYMLDPRLDDRSEKLLKKMLIDMGADESKIKKSDLYSFKALSIKWK